MKAVRPIIVLAIIVTLFLSMLLAINLGRGRLRRTACAQQLQSLGMLLKSYASEHSGSLPKSLESLDKVDKNLAVPLLSCPGLKWKSNGRHSAVDYNYIDWSGLSTVGVTEFPVLYDRSCSNHSGKGVNILMMDGSVKWDEEANWLRSFAKAHPEAHLPLP